MKEAAVPGTRMGKSGKPILVLNGGASSLKFALFGREPVPARFFSCVKDGNGTGANCDHGAVGKTDPLALVLAEQPIAYSPVLRFVLAPVRVDKFCYIRR